MENVNIILADGVEIQKSCFDPTGGMFSFIIPKECDLVILMGNCGGGYVPFRSLLPHQVYEKDIEKIMKEERFEVIYVVPISSKSPFPIAYNGEYGKRRWEEKRNG